MKKYFLSIVALAGMLFATSCQESLVEPQVGGTTTFTIEVPGQMGTKAEDVTYNLYVEVYDVDGGERLDRITGKQIISGTPTTVSLNLVATQKYDIIFWAQKSDATHNVSNLKNVGIKYDYHNTEDGEAYYAIMNDFEPIQAKNPSVSLTRPFAQLNIATLDVVDYKKDGNNKMTITRAEILISQVAKNFERQGSSDTYGVGATPAIYNPSADDIYSDKKFVVNEVGYTHISMDYLAVVGNDALVDVTVKLDVEDPYGVPSHIERTITNVPLKLNYKTNIVGNLITSASDFTVSIDEDWLGENNEVKEFVGVEVSNEQELLAAIADPNVDAVALINDIELSQTLTFSVPQSSAIARASESTQRRDFIFDGNGKTLKSKAARAINVSGISGLTIKNLVIECTGERAINIIQNATNVTIDNVTATAANYTVNVAGSAPKAIVNIENSTLNGLCTVNVGGAGAEVYVNNSTVNCNDNNTTEGESYAALCLNRDGIRGKIIATNTVVNVTEGSDSHKGRNGAEDGVVTINGSTDDVAVMVAVITYPGSPYYHSFASLNEAFEFAKSNDVITLIRDITVAETVVIGEDKTVVLDLNGKTLTAADINVIKNNGGNLTIKNGTVTRTGDAVGYSVNNASGEITVENATINRGLYTSGSKMTAIDAKISHDQSSRHAIYAWDCEVNIKSGTFHNDNPGNATLMASGSSIVTINGGTFSIADGRSSLGWTSSMIDQNGTAQVTIKDGLFNGGFRINSADTKLTIEGGEFNTNNGSSFTDYSGTKVVKGGKFTDEGAWTWAKKYIAEGCVGLEVTENGKKVFIVNESEATITINSGAELNLNDIDCNVTIKALGDLTIKGNAKIKTLQATNGGIITIEDGKTLTLNNFSFGSKDTAGKEYEIKGGTVVANYGFFQHGKYALRSNFETGYMYYSFGSDITVYGTFYSQGKGDGLDYVRGNLTIAKGGSSIHDKSLWVGQPESWGPMEATLTIEPGGYVQVNSLSVYKGSKLTYSNDADLKYNSVTGTEYIIKK